MNNYRIPLTSIRKSIAVGVLLVALLATLKRADPLNVVAELAIDLSYYALAVVIILIIAPAYVNWMVDTLLDFFRQAREIAAISKHSERELAAAERYNAQNTVIQSIRLLSRSHVEYGINLLNDSDTLEISGNYVSWSVDGFKIPVTFTIEYLEAWEKRGIAGDQLPAQSDFSSPNREQKRKWARAVASALSKIGAAQLPASQYPPRWIYSDPAQRNKAMQMIGFTIAYDVAQYLLREGKN